MRIVRPFQFFAAPFAFAPIFALVFSFLFVSAASARDFLPMPVAQALSRAGVPAASVGLAAQYVHAKRPVVSYNTQAAMNPASVMKLVTACAALDILGPAYAWKTEVYLNGPLRGDVLDGDLLIKGYGDPQLNIEQFWLLLHGLRARGVREIRGDLVLDRSWFAAETHDAASFDNEPLRPYNVGADALLLNFKSVRYRLIPDPQNKSVQIIPEPALAKVETENRVALGDGPCYDWRSALSLVVGEDGDGAQLRFSGVYPLSCGERNWNVALLTHPKFVLAAFRALWVELGGSFTGNVRDGAVPYGATPFATQSSASLADAVRDMNKFSNNTMARQILLTLSAEIFQQPGRYDKSIQIVNDWLRQRGLDMPELILENGSGLSRAERISVGSLQKLLLAAYNSRVMPEFISSMPLLGRDGTAQRRLKNDPATGQAHVKTGSLNDVRSIAGYLLDRNGRRIAFSFIVNHPKADATQDAQDAFMRWLYNAGESPTLN
ncbi:MAG TPA: D-alanyl-D-alanine carboxypeptidase/D-alanyl-D-alanine-endopeptidase [Burkholderiales bacterium]|nr:D-alanyl-D-alanine carboxypeptidase/D-alanyl-D-alanine-endopeptidase [Burkholderiales bacterium]